MTGFSDTPLKVVKNYKIVVTFRDRIFYLCRDYFLNATRIIQELISKRAEDIFI